MATFAKVNKSFQVLLVAKTRDQLPSCKKMEKFIQVITNSKPTWSEEDQGAFTKLVAEQMPPLLFERFQNSLRNIAGLPVASQKRPASFEEAVKGRKALEAELAQLRADIEALKEALARKGKAKQTKQPELPM